mgnify:CR=1 FL=1
MKHKSRKKPKSRPQGWVDAAERAAAVQQLIDIQSEYQDWLDALPEALESTAVAEKLEAVVDLELSEIEAVLQECEYLELPLGFGRD